MVVRGNEEVAELIKMRRQHINDSGSGGAHDAAQECVDVGPLVDRWASWSPSAVATSFFLVVNSHELMQFCCIWKKLEFTGGVVESRVDLYPFHLCRRIVNETAGMRKI